MKAIRVLAVFAHPGDETFRCGGTLALLARCGVRAQVLTATRGQAGSRGDPSLCTPDEFPAMRENELRCACAPWVFISNQAATVLHPTSPEAKFAFVMGN
jgi:LmbE family N-acetylglucosaminyl deacetylase